jgi:hypothetical protein
MLLLVMTTSVALLAGPPIVGLTDWIAGQSSAGFGRRIPPVVLRQHEDEPGEATHQLAPGLRVRALVVPRPSLQPLIEQRQVDLGVHKVLVASGISDAARDSDEA